MRNKLAKNSIAVGLVTLIITAGLSFSAQGAPGDVSQATGKGVGGTGLFSILDGNSCVAENAGGDSAPTDGTPQGVCGPGLDLEGVDAYVQNATANDDGSSTATSSVAGTDVLATGATVQIGDLLEGLSVSNTSDLLNGVLGGASQLVLDLINLLGLDTVVDAIDGALAQVLGAVDQALPISVETGEVFATCEATPGAASGNGTAAGTNIVVDLGGQQIRVPLTADTSPNSNLLVGAPEELVSDIVDGLAATLETSLGGALGALGPLLVGLSDDLVEPLLNALEEPLLQPLADALAGIVAGTVNKQESSGTGHIDVTALSLTVLGSNTLNLANVTCGVNAGPAADDEDAPADEDVDTETDVDVDVDVDQDVDVDLDTDVDADQDADADAAADADSQADADVTTTLPATGSPNLLPFWMLGLGLLLFGATVLLNEKRRLQV